MKDVFTERSVSDFHHLILDLVESLEDTLGKNDNEAVKTWCEYVRCTPASDLIASWYLTISTHMNRQHAKYVRAVTSITNQPTTVYHAVRYKDVVAIAACADPLAPLGTPHCVADMSESNAIIFWKYMCELSDICLRWKQVSPMLVPSHTEISADIEARRRIKDGASTSAVTPHTPAVKGLTQGVDDLWSQLCRQRRVTVPITDAVRREIREFVRGGMDASKLPAVFPDLGTGAYAPEEMAIFERMKSLVTMDDSIPCNMMRGIETVANRLVNDINSGRCDLGNIDLEEIGKQVISGVSDEDMGTFASNIDKLIPALQRAHQTLP